MTSHLLIALSAHGFGHIGQTAPVLVALRRRLPTLRVTVRSGAPSIKIHERFGSDVECQTANLDIGMIQRNALDIRVDATAEAYKILHASWSERVAVEALTLSDIDPDLVLANIPYLSLAAAKQADIPSVALCSLNWADIYRYYFEGRRDEAQQVIDDMLSAYNSAIQFLQPEPRLPMPDLSNALPIGPVAQLGVPRREEVSRKTRTGPQDRLVMVSLGGMDVRLPVEEWGSLENVHFIVPGAWRAQGNHVSSFEDLEVPFADVLASCDALVAKPGYGSFVEAACLGIPVLYLDRPNWPEVPYMVDWLECKGRSARIALDQLQGDSIGSALDDLWSASAEPPAPVGVDQAAGFLADLLS